MKSLFEKININVEENACFCNEDGDMETLSR